MTTPAVAVIPRQQKQVAHAAIDNRCEMDVPLDFSFYNLIAPSDIEFEEPRAQGNKKVKKNSDEKYCSKCLRLSNNNICEMKGFMDVLDKCVAQPSAISWIDLSFNELAKIDAVFCDFPSLQILYLHGNHINETKEVDKLMGIGSLKKLALHGNPIESTKNYRWYVLSLIPQLINFDMSAVTKADRATAATWKKSSASTKKGKSRQEDS